MMRLYLAPLVALACVVGGVASGVPNASLDRVMLSAFLMVSVPWVLEETWKALERNRRCRDVRPGS